MPMGYTTEEGRTQILDEAGAAVDQLSIAVAALGEAYEHLDEAAGDRMEADLFRPLQSAYGHWLKRTLGEFAPALGSADPRFPGGAAAPLPRIHEPRSSTPPMLFRPPTR